MVRLVLVDGLFGMGINSAVVQHLEERFEGARIIKLSCGGVSSVRDRACECFYQLKGGTIDYELEDFPLESGHGRWGATEEGRFEAWGEDNPVILVGYSLGAPTARYLHHLLAKQSFRRPDGTRIETSASWVSAILTVNGVNNGTVAVHAVGLGRETLEPVSLTILWWIFTAIYVIVWIDIPYLDRACGLRLEHWEARRRHGVSLFRLLTWRPGTQDNAGRDLCPERARALNEEMASTLDARMQGTRHIAAYSFCTLKMPEKLTTSLRSLSRRHMPNYRMIFRVPYCIFLIPFTLIIGISSWGKDGTEEEEEDGEWQEEQYASDGVVSVRCQLPPHNEPCANEGPWDVGSSGKAAAAGGWTKVKMRQKFDHIDLMEDGEEQRQAFTQLFGLAIESGLAVSRRGKMDSGDRSSGKRGPRWWRIMLGS